MSDIAKYTFIPFVRIGIGNEITETDTLGAASNAMVVERPEVEVSFKVKASGGSSPEATEPVSKRVKIEGPGDVLGVQRDQVIRVHPAHGVENFETGNLVYMEFYEEDFPWRFTPARPSGPNLRPWVALLILKEDEFTRNTQGGTPTPFIRIKETALQKVFYPETELHHFAHVHVLETLADSIQSSASQAANQLGGTVGRNPDLALSRIICPRKPDPNSTFHAFLVPAYETGRLAGLGQDTAGIIAQKPSWQRSNLGNIPFDMPYYYTWSFKTDDNGDFEKLVRAIKVRSVAANSAREMDLTAPGLGLKPEGNDATIGAEGALQSTTHQTTPWPVDDPTLQSKLKDILNLNSTLQTTNPTIPSGDFYSPKLAEDPVITPPVYGRWHALVDNLTNKADWVHTLNLHPTHRAAAGLGTRVVQEHQEEFMEMAWNQIGAINEANQRIIENEAVKRASEKLYRKNISKMDQFTLLNTLGKTLEVIPNDNTSTAKKRLKDSRVPTAFRTGTFTRVANNFSRTALMNPSRNDTAPEVMNQNLLLRSDADESGLIRTGTDPYGNAIEKPAITAAPKRGKFEIEINPVFLKGAIDKVIEKAPLPFLGKLCDAIAAQGTNFTIAQVLGNLPPDFQETQQKRADHILGAILHRAWSDGILSLVIKSSVYELRISNEYHTADFDITNGPVKTIRTICLRKEHVPAEPVEFKYNDVLEARKEFRKLFNSSFLNHDQTAPLAFVRHQNIALSSVTFSDKIRNGFSPMRNFLRKINAFIQADAENNGKPLMAYPRFPIPVYDYLKAISQDYIIPNISDIPGNTIALMKPNKAFVEAFLAGMNHEFSRELLWREFPTDMRGSYFRHFWEYDNDPSKEMLPQPGESEADFHKNIINFQDAAADVEELHKWNKNLGLNHLRQFGLILLVKGDLFRKYPDTMVYAQKGKFVTVNGKKTRTLTEYIPANVQWPVITGNLAPDVYFFGFTLSETQARGDTANPGWFFVLRERPGQISFGLDEFDGPGAPGKPDDWDDLTWSHLTPGVASPTYLKIDAFPAGAVPNNTNGVSWGTSSAETAYVLYQDPVLYAKHASLLLPK
jgi:hypothetical protein